MVLIHDTMILTIEDYNLLTIPDESILRTVSGSDANPWYSQLKVIIFQPPQMSLSRVLYQEAMLTHASPPYSTPTNVVDNREKIKLWISEQGY